MLLDRLLQWLQDANSSHETIQNSTPPTESNLTITSLANNQSLDKINEKKKRNQVKRIVRVYVNWLELQGAIRAEDTNDIIQKVNEYLSIYFRRDRIINYNVNLFYY